MNKVIGIIGGSGMIGSELSNYLRDSGYEVLIFSRKAGKYLYQFNYSSREADVEALKRCEVLINLAGANVGAHRWTEVFKREIYESRVQLTNFLAEMISVHGISPKLYIGASATGFYPEGLAEVLDEETPAGDDFLAQVCSDWEQAHSRVSKLCGRFAILRTGVVMGLQGGFIPRVLPLVKWGLAAPLGNGKQQMPWIALDDLVRMVGLIIENTAASGVFNGVAPSHLSNREAMKVMCQKMHKKLWLPPVPAILLKWIFGGFSIELLGSRRVKPKRMEALGFQWRYPNFSDLNFI